MEIQQNQQESYIFKHGSSIEGLIQPPPPTSASPPSATSSPSHDFSFTISLHQSTTSSGTNTIPPDKKAKSPAASSNIALMDLSPADDIFFHGHLLPLHLLSHLPVSPRSSTNSLDSFTLPIKELLEEKNLDNSTISNHEKKGDCNGYIYRENVDYGIKTRSKSKSFSWLSSKWRKENEAKEGQKRKLKFDVTQVLKRYMRMVRPLLSFRNSSRRESVEFERKAYSYSSGNISMRRKQENNHGYGGRRRGGEFSAPASMRTSPTNSGLLVASGPLSNSSSSDSSMEELQAAIQAAIAHCKNSIAVEDKIKCP